MFTLFAQDEEELDSLTQSLESKANDFLCQAKKLNAQQLAVFNSTLPLANLAIQID
ncbi:MAG: hypothetical protein R3Y67_09390 [Eubacteriales bacterium]